jgi:hypothetical protein
MPSLSTSDSAIWLINDSTNANWDNKTGRVFGYDSSISSTSSCISPISAHWIKSRLVANRYAMEFPTVCDGQTKKDLDLTQLNIEFKVEQRGSEKQISNPEMVHSQDKFRLIATDLEDHTYIYAVKISQKGSTDGYVEMAFDYEVELSAFMIALYVLYYV